MAEPDYDAPSWVHVRTNAGNRDAELTAPLLSAHAPFQQQLPPLYPSQYMPSSNPSMSQAQDTSNVSANSHAPICPPLPSPGNRHQYYATYPHPYQFMNLQRPSPVWNGPPQLHPGHAFYDPGVMMQSHQPLPHPGTSSHNHQLLPPSHRGLPQHARRRHDYRMSVESVAHTAHADSVRTPQEGNQSSAPEARAQHPGLLPQEAIRPGDATYFATGQRRWMSPEDPSRRSDGSVSPRTSNRRNFERYSIDLSHSSTSSDAEEVAARAPPMNRMRHRPREVRPRMAGRYAHFDPNIATVRQIQELKNNLRRHLPSTLPEKASKACDICQKNYATTHVSPTEEEEIAIELSCGHTFGEFCISQWVSGSRSDMSDAC